MHLKRQRVPKQWPLQRKGTAYVVRPSSSIKRGIPILIIFRDLLKLAKNRKEVKKAIQNKQIMLNNRFVRDEKEVVQIFDKIKIVPSNEYLSAKITKNRKYWFEKISEAEAGKKISRVIGKKMLKNKKNQINLLDGRNLISNEKCKTGDSVVIDLKNKKILKVLALKEKAKVLVFAGKHSGTEGIVEKIKEERKMAEIKTDKEKINVLIKQIMVIE
jgi:small subunit ribosomal protein S4e